MRKDKELRRDLAPVQLRIQQHGRHGRIFVFVTVQQEHWRCFAVELEPALSTGITDILYPVLANGNTDILVNGTRILCGDGTGILLADFYFRCLRTYDRRDAE